MLDNNEKLDSTVQRHRIVFLSMYPLDRIDKGPKVRISNLYHALSQLCAVDLIAGLNTERRRVVRQYLNDKRFEGAFGLYVESSTGWCTLPDLRLMAACRRTGIPVLTWIRDAYPMFPQTMFGIPLYKRVGASVLWRLSMWGYMHTSDAIGSQSDSFSWLFRYPAGVQRIVLPQGARELDVPPILAQANALLYTGNASQPRFGVELLVEAAEVARRRVPGLRLLLVCPPTGLPPQALCAGRPWIELLSLETDEIPALLPQVRAVVNPLRDAPYHRLQIPTKIMGYLGYGRPILATDLPEVRGVIEDSHSGVIVPDTVEGLAQGIVDLCTADLGILNQMGQNALRAVREKHAWRHRARQILDTFKAIRGGQK
jgi:glycosyltransferase involved in cell wall biosynthesis